MSFKSTNSKIDEITGIPNNLSLTSSNNFVCYEDDLNNLHLSHALIEK